jgi:predicted MarR family transcription regulator
MNRLCDDCLTDIMYNLSKEDILILETLKKEKTANQLLAISKPKIITQTQDMTDFKFQMSVGRLEICNLVGRNPKKKPNTFFITPSGNKILELFKKSMKGE